MQSTHHAMLQSDTHMLMAMADDAASSPSSTSSPSPRLSDAFPSNNETLEDIAALMTTSRSAAAVSASAAKQAKPKLAVSASGRFQDQFYHAQEASRAMGIFKNRAIVKQTTDGQRSDATVKRKKSINVNGRDVEQFSDADIVFAGYLVKQGSFWKTWRRRYFILRRDVNVLAYYTSQENLVKLGEIAIDATTRVEPPSSAATSAFPGRFTVEHNGRKLVLVAEDGRESAETWAKIIGRCITTRTAEAEAAALTALMGSSRGSSERESMRSSLMQLRSSMNGSQLTPQDGATKKPVRVISSANSGPAPLPPAAPAAPPTAAAEPVKRESFKKGLIPVDQPHTDATRTNSTMMEPFSGKENAAANSATKMKRHSTDSVLIQAAADEAVLRRGSMGLNDAGRDRLVHNARLKSIDSANDSARKLLDAKTKAPVRSNSTEAPPSAGKPQSAGRASAPAPRRLFRSYSAGSVLSTRSIGFDDVRSTHDDCGLLSAHMSSRGSYPDPNSNKHLRVDRETRERNGTNADSGSDTRSRNLSLPSLRPVASVELSVSVGCRGTQDVSYMLVVLSAIAPSVNRGEAKELARTEVQGALSLRACGGDFFARDFSALLPVPISASARNLMLQFEIFSVINLSTENLTVQQSLGFVRIPHTDLLFSGDSTLVLECLRARQSPSKQKHFLVLDRIRPSESLNLGHSYVYAKRHFVADIVPVGASSTDMVTWITTSTIAAAEKPGNRSSFETVATSPAASTAATDTSRSSLTYAGMIRGTLESADATQVFISEELSSSYCSISVAAKYMGLLQQRNRRRMHDAKLLINDIEQKYEKMPSSPNSRTEAGDIINLHSEMIRDAESRVEYYRKLYESYVECEDYYDVLLAMLEDGKEPGITGSLKRSVQKKDKRTEFMPTNLNCHVVRARRVALSSSSAVTSTKDPGTRERSLIGGAKGDELVYAVVTHGCPAAHCLGFKDGGLRRLQASLAQSKEDDPRLRERVEQRQDVVHCQILSIASASFLTVIGLAANQSARHQERLRLMCQTGFLLNMESLLSTIKNEKGMIEDMYEGVQWLNTNVSFQVVQSLEESPKLKCAKCVAITSSEKREVTATFALPSDVFATLPEVLKHGHALKVHAVMFTQGINEMQSVANTVLDTSLQDEINLESATRLVRYFQVYKTHVLAMQPPNQDRIDDLADLEIELQIVAEKLNQSRKSHVQKKNVNILIESSDLCRRLGAGRTTCCKSGKDRTAMSVTLECSRLLVDKFHVRQGVHLTNAMRERGVRRVNVLANTGKNKFAFNSFQLKYLPDCYRPPVLSADSSVQS